MRYKLTDPTTVLPQISAKYEKILERLEIRTIKDLITYFPVKYLDTNDVIEIKDLLALPNEEEKYLIKVKIRDFKNNYVRSRLSIQNAVAYDETGEIKCQWFNQPYFQRVFQKNSEFLLFGKIKKKGKNFIFQPTIYEEVLEGRESVHLSRLTPEYSLTDGLTKKWFRNRIKYLVDNIEEIEIIDEITSLDAVVSHGMPLPKSNIREEIAAAHFPEDSDILDSAVRNLSLREFVNLQLRLLVKNSKLKKLKAIKLDRLIDTESEVLQFLEKLPFELTDDQKNILKIAVDNRSKEDLFEKMKNQTPLNELIQGDVGSGKTIIAIALSLAVCKSGYQTIVLAPTTILAKQHYETFNKFLKDEGLKIELVVSEKKETGSADIIIGTTAVLARKKSIVTKPGLIIVDEQHKFGVVQREELLKEYKNAYDGKFIPHFIDMTATPIPRSIVQTLFGDVGVHRILTKPKGRLPIRTHLVPAEKRESSLAWIHEEVKKGFQVYWVCPLVSDSDKLQVKAATSTFEELKEYYGTKLVGLIHGQMKEKEKLEIMKNFSEGKIKILVTTSVIEVGIDVPNANVIVIESSERFGLAQLHQLRGRVGRGSEQSWCFLFTSEEISDKATQRLEYFTKTNDGLKIAEFDLALRGPGEVYGTKQSGIPNFKIASFRDLSLITESKKIAEQLFKKGIKKIELFS
jgi:ATP-dependent DNA helicase RecG